MVKIDGREVKDILNDTPPEFVFYLNDGKILHNPEELRDALYTMSDDTYAYHVTSEKNDFANWVNDIIHDSKLARDLRKARNREGAAKLVAQRVTYLKGKLK